MFCFFRCLHYFSMNEKLQSHPMDCQKINDCAIRLPSEDEKWLEFGNNCNKERVPFVVYADLECVLRKMEPDREDASSYVVAYTEYLMLLMTICIPCRVPSSVKRTPSRRRR